MSFPSPNRLGHHVARISLLFVRSLCVAAAACGSGRGATTPARDDRATMECPIDAARAAVEDRSPAASQACRRGDLAACEAECGTGRTESCRASGYAHERAHHDAAAADAYSKACRLGDANACTNLGAHRWSGHGGVSKECAVSLFELACERREHFGCGMVGRVAVEGWMGPRDVDRGRAQLERSCEALGGFPCATLGRYWSDGSFGEVDEAKAREANARACETGFDEACETLPPASAGTKL